MTIDLTDKVIVVTGSSRGIGSKLIKAFSEENAKIVINYNSSETEAEFLYNEIIQHNPNCIKIKADVTSIDDIKKLYNETILNFGKIDVLINNAGICDDNLIQELTDAQWRRVIDVNLMGVYLCCKTFSQLIIKQSFGKIINIASLKGQEGCEGQTNYSASKAGVIGFTLALAKELGKYNISVNAICPGFIVTDLNRHNNIKKMLAEKRSLMSIEHNLNDLINFILYMSSDKMHSVSGQVFNVDSRK